MDNNNLNSHIPTESETIKVRRAARLADKISQARGGFAIKRAWWSNGPLEFFIIFFIFVLNFYLLLPFFGSDAAPTSYSGPVIPLLAHIVQFIGRISMVKALQVVNIAFFSLLPLSLYMIVKKISERKVAALLAALFVSLPFSPFARERALGVFGGIESAHIASLSLIPLAIFGLMLFLNRGGVKSLLVASLSSALVALISPFGFLTFSIFAVIVVFSEILIGRGRLKMFRFLAVLLFTGGLCSFWYNPAFFLWMVIGPMGEELRRTIYKLIPISLFSIPVMATFGYLLFDRKPKLQSVFLASFFLIAFVMIVFAGGGLMPSHPSRYLSELGIALSIFLGVIITKISDLVLVLNSKKLSGKSRYLVANAVLTIFLLGLIVCIVIGREQILLGNQVLGLWTDINKGEIWIAKDQFKGLPAFMGYGISSLSVFGLGFLLVKQKEISNH